MFIQDLFNVTRQNQYARATWIAFLNPKSRQCNNVMNAFNILPWRMKKGIKYREEVARIWNANNVLRETQFVLNSNRGRRTKKTWRKLPQPSRPCVTNAGNVIQQPPFAKNQSRKICLVVSDILCPLQYSACINQTQWNLSHVFGTKVKQITCT